MELLVGNRQTELGSTVVDNPFFTKAHPENHGNPKRIPVAVNLKESAVVSLSVRGKLKPHQVAAATRFRDAFETLAGKKGANPQQLVQYAQPRSITVRIVMAGDDLRRARSLLGERCYTLVVRVCGEGKALGEVFHAKRERLTGADNLRASLSDLAELWGMGCD